MVIMRYKDVAAFLAGIERVGYRYVHTIITPDISDLIFYTDGNRTIIMENRGRVSGFTVFHSSMLADSNEEMRRIIAHLPIKQRII